MDAPLLFALARARLKAGASVQSLWASPRALCLEWAGDRRVGLEAGMSWLFLLSPSPELWLLHEKDPAMIAMRAEAKVDATRRWGHELKGARLEAVEGDERERWLGLLFRRRAITGRIELMQLAFQAIPGRAGLRLDGLDLNPARIGMGIPFPANAPEAPPDSPPMRRWHEHFGEDLAKALAGEWPEVLPGEGSLAMRHRAWSLERAKTLILEPRRAIQEKRWKREEEKLVRYGEALKADRQRHEKHLALRHQAEKLAAELWRIKGQDGEVELQDGSRVALPPGWQAQMAVQKWFEAAKRAERGLERVALLERERQRQVLELQMKKQASLLKPLEMVTKAGDVWQKKRKPLKGHRAMDKVAQNSDKKNGAGKRADGKGKAFRNVWVDGWELLIGKGDADNDTLTFKVADGVDFWLHVAGVPGSHVVIRNPDRISEPPREVTERAAQLAAFYSKARDGGKVEVHFCRVADVSKPRGFAPGKVMLKTYKSIRVYPKE